MALLGEGSGERASAVSVSRTGVGSGEWGRRGTRGTRGRVKTQNSAHSSQIASFVTGEKLDQGSEESPGSAYAKTGRGFNNTLRLVLSYVTGNSQKIRVVAWG